MQPQQSVPNQSGFSVIAVLLITLVVAVLAVAGLVVYQHHRSSSIKNTATTQPKSMTTIQLVQTANQNTIKIPELGIELTLPDSIKGLTYAVFSRDQVNGRPSITVGLSTTALVSADIGCVPNHAPYGWLSKTEGQYPENATTLNSSGLLVKQFSGYYIARTTPQSTCSDKMNIENEQVADNHTIAGLNWSTAVTPLQ